MVLCYITKLFALFLLWAIHQEQLRALYHLGTLLTMRLLVKSLTLCLVLSQCFTAPSKHKEEHGKHDKEHGHDLHPDPKLDRCGGIEYDAVVADEDRVLYFFKGDHMFKGFRGKAELFNKTFHELDDHHHLGHIDAAFRMQSDSPDHHYHQFFFLDNKVFSYNKHKLEEGYPKVISEVFPGIPNNLDAAVECPKPECPEDTAVFFKGNNIYHFDMKTKKVDEKEFKGMPNCTAAFRYMGHYYCLHELQFSKFDPNTAEVHGQYPKMTRDYFMRCPHFGNKSVEDNIKREQCSRVHLDAITSDDAGHIYAFRGHHFLSITGDQFHSDTIASAFKEVHGEVDSVFSHEGHFYIIKDDQVYVYKVGEPHTHLEGYPKPLKKVLGIEGPVDAAFVCSGQHIVHVIKGQKIYDVDLKATPPAPVKERTITTFKKIDTAMCGPKGVTVVIGNHYYNYQSVMTMLMGRLIPEEHKVSKDLFGCDH